MNTASAASTVRFRETVLLLLILVLAFAAFSYRLGEIPPYHNDENFYVESARHMVESGDYLTPVYHEKKRFAKPPLFYWLVSLAYKTFGVQLASARGVSAVFGTLCIAVTFFLARRLFGREAALVSAFLLPGMVLHFQISRWAITDMTLNFFILLAFYFFVRGYQEEKTRPRDFLLFYGAIALGFLTKGPPALVIPGLTLALFLLLRRDGALVRQLRLGTGALIVIAVNLPWFALMFHLHGDAFKDHILGAEIRDRIVHDTPFSGYYVGVLFRYFLPWSLFFLSALTVYLGWASFHPRRWESVGAYLSALPRTMKTHILSWSRTDTGALLLCFLWIFVPVVFFTLFRIEHSRYLLPIAPAMAMVLAHFFIRLQETPAGFRRGLFAIPFFLSMVLYLLLILATGAGVLVYHNFFEVPFRIMFLPVLLGFGAAYVVLLYLYRQKLRIVLALALLQLLILAPLSGDALPFFNRYPMKHFARVVERTHPPVQKIGVYRLGNHRARIGIRTGVMAFDLFNAEMLHRFLDTEEKVFVVMRERVWKENFRDLPLRLRATDQSWKKTRVDWPMIQKLWRGQIEPNPEDLLDPIVLLSNRGPAFTGREAGSSRKNRNGYSPGSPGK